MNNDCYLVEFRENPPFSNRARWSNSNFNNEQLDRMDTLLKKNSSHWSIDLLCNLFIWTNAFRITHGKKIEV